MTTDTFTRTTAFGLDGSPSFGYTWVNRDSQHGSAAASEFYCDGNGVVLPGTGTYDSYIINWITANPTSGTASFDIDYPVLPTDGDYFPSVILRFSGTRYPIYLATETDFAYDVTTDPHIRIGGDLNDNTIQWGYGPFISVAIEPGNRYTAKVGYFNRLVAYKFWKTADPEPDWMAMGQANSETATYSDTWIDFWYDGTVDAKLDNLTYNAGAFGPAFSADAFIVSAPDAGPIFRATDTFTRVVAAGLGDGWFFIAPPSWESWVSIFSPESSSTITVDGSKAITTADGLQTVYRFPSQVADTGSISWDIYLPSSIGNGQTMGIELARRGRTFDVTSFLFKSGGSWFFQVGVGTGNVTFPAFNAWYTVTIVFNNYGSIDGYIVPQGGGTEVVHLYSSANNLVGTGAEWDSLILTSEAANYIDNVNWISAPVGLTADASLIAAAPGFTADAFFVAASSTAFTADAVIKATRSGTLTGDARIVINQTGSFTADAVIPLHILANAYIVTGRNQHYPARDHTGTQSDVFVMLDSTVGPFSSGTLLHEVIFELVSRVPEIDPLIFSIATGYPAETTVRNRHLRWDDHGGFTDLSTLVLGADIGNVPAIGSYPAGTLVSTVLSDLFTALAGRSLSADAAIAGSTSDSFQAFARIGHFNTVLCDAVLKKGPTGSFTANAVIAFKIPANAVLKKNRAFTFTANATIVKAFFRTDAVLKKTRSFSFTATAEVIL